MATHKALCVVTRCATVDDFVDTFCAFCDGPTLFVATKVQRPVGLETPFSFLLADRTPVLSGVGIVREVFTSTENVFRRPGLRLELSKLTPDSVAVHNRITPASKQPPATSSIDAPTIPRASSSRASSPRLSTNPGVSTSPGVSTRASTSPGVSTNSRAPTSPGVSTNSRASTSPGVSTSPRASTSPGVSTSPGISTSLRASTSASSKATPRSDTPKLSTPLATPSHGTPKLSPPLATPSNGTPLDLFADLDLFDQTAPIAIIGDDGSVPLVDMSAAAAPRPTTAPSDATPSTANAPLGSLELELEPAPAATSAAKTGRARTSDPAISFREAPRGEGIVAGDQSHRSRTSAADAPAPVGACIEPAAAPRAEPAPAMRAEPAAATRAEAVAATRAEPETAPGAKPAVSHRRQMIGVGVLCALGGAALTLATMRLTRSSEAAATTTVAYRPDVGARHRPQPARKASVDVRTAPRTSATPAGPGAASIAPAAAAGTPTASPASAPAATPPPTAAPSAATALPAAAPPATPSPTAAPSAATTLPAAVPPATPPPTAAPSAGASPVVATPTTAPPTAASSAGASPAVATPTAASPTAAAPTAASPAVAAPAAGARCRLSIAATPADSEIRVGERVLGKSPANYAGDCVSLVVEVSHARYATSTQMITFDGGTSKTLAVQLARPMHQVEVVSSPPGASITIAGRVVGTTPAVVEMKGFSSVDVTLDKPGVGRTTVQHYSRKPTDRLSVSIGR